MSGYLPFPKQLLVLEGYLLAAFLWALSLDTKPSPKMNRQKGIEIMQDMREWRKLGCWDHPAAGLCQSQRPYRPTPSRACKPAASPQLWALPWRQDSAHSFLRSGSLKGVIYPGQCWILRGLTHSPASLQLSNLPGPWYPWCVPKRKAPSMSYTVLNSHPHTWLSLPLHPVLLNIFCDLKNPFPSSTKSPIILASLLDIL